MGPTGPGTGQATVSAVQQAYDAVVEYVRSAPVGTRLPSERELAARFGVSRTTIRSATDRLVLSGHLDVRRGSGTVIRRPGPEHLAVPFVDALAGASSLSDVFEVRLLLEPQLAARVAKLASPAITTDLRSAAGSEDAHFHRLLADFAGNGVAAKVVGVLVELTSSASGTPEPTSGRAETRARQHAAVVEAVADGDHELARQSMKLHLRWEARLLTARKAA